MKSDSFLLFVRPDEFPRILEGKDVRIFYGGHWIDFRDGEIKLTDESEQIEHDLRT